MKGGKLLKIAGDRYTEIADTILDHAWGDGGITHNSAGSINISAGKDIIFGEYEAPPLPGTILYFVDKAYFANKIEEIVYETTQGETISYKVVLGDSLSTIAAKHKTSVVKIKQDNNLKSDTINLGQVLTITGTTSEKVIGKNITFTPITNASVGSTVYIVVETKGLQGKTVKLNVRQGKENLLANKDIALAITQNDTEKRQVTACVGELADYEDHLNKNYLQNLAAVEVTLAPKDAEVLKEWNTKIQTKEDKKTYLYLLVEADVENHNKTVLYKGRKETGDDSTTPNLFLNEEGNWFILLPHSAPWMLYAIKYVGIYEDSTSKSNPIIQSWIDNHNQDFGLEGSNRPITSDNEPWCGIFVYNMLRLADVTVERGASWEYPSKASFFKDNWENSYKIDEPKHGAIAKMNWSHVTFVYDFDDTHVFVLGGNQAENGAAVRDGVTVNIVKYKRAQVQEYRMPNEY